MTETNQTIHDEVQAESAKSKHEKKQQEPETITRRQFLKTAGAVLVVLSVGGLVWRAVDQGVFSTGKGAAYELWAVDEDPALAGPLALVHAAILASNPHNTQPWLFRVTESSIDLYADERRHLGTMDPLHREMQIGLGCALENMILAAEAHSLATQVTYYPSTEDPSYVARVELYPGEKKDSKLYQAIPERRTHRGAYDPERPIKPELLTEIEALCKDEENVKLVWLTSPEQLKAAGELTIAATEAITLDKEMSRDTNRWYRHAWRDIQKHRDGLTLDVQGGPLWLRVIGKMLPALSSDTANQFWLKSTRDPHTSTAVAYGVLAVKDFSQLEQRVRLGRIWQRIHLQGTVKGIAMHPLNQPVEMRDRELQLGIAPHYGEKLRAFMPELGWEPLFLFRAGYASKETFKSPRRAVGDVLV